MVRNFRKPLIVVGPKLLLRLPVSKMHEHPIQENSRSFAYEIGTSFGAPYVR